jgi:galactokinase
VEHNLANTAYNERVNECNEALKIINKNADTNFSFLCEVPEKILNNNKKFLHKTLFSRASFVIKENLRTIKSAEILENNKLFELGKLMYESHFGLSKLYKVSCEELDFFS